MTPLTDDRAALVGSFKASMGTLASGVVIVTCQMDGRPWGLTVSACSSISADPPVVMVSLGLNTASTPAIREQGMFGVSVLGADGLAAAKAGAQPGAPKYIAEEHLINPDPRDPGSPLTPAVRPGLAHLDCRVEQELVVNDHVVFFGAVQKVTGDVVSQQIADPSPLVYFNRKFYSLGTAGLL